MWLPVTPFAYERPLCAKSGHSPIECYGTLGVRKLTAPVHKTTTRNKRGEGAFEARYDLSHLEKPNYSVLKRYSRSFSR
jgi:hypothetical protein